MFRDTGARLNAEQKKIQRIVRKIEHLPQRTGEVELRDRIKPDQGR